MEQATLPQRDAIEKLLDGYPGLDKKVVYERVKQLSKQEASPLVAHYVAAGRFKYSEVQFSLNTDRKERVTKAATRVAKELGLIPDNCLICKQNRATCSC